MANLGSTIEQIIKEVPTKISELENDMNFVAGDNTATQSVNGLMSSIDKIHLDSIWSLWGSEEDADALVNKVQEVLAIFENYQEGDTIVDLLANNYFSYTLNSGVNVVGNTKSVAKINPQTLFVPNGLIMGGTAAAAGLVTRGICGVSTPNAANGSCTKENLYINYDGDNTYRTNRQLVLQAGSVGTHYGNNLYQFCVTRGDIVKAYCDAHYALKSTIPVVNNPKVIINQAGTKKGEFTLNQSGNDITINLTDSNTTYNIATTTTNGLMSSEDKTKLNNIPSNAEANVINVIKVDGTSIIPTNKIVNIDLSSKVDKIDGKGLSTNDYTSEDKTKLDGIVIDGDSTFTSTTKNNIPTKGAVSDYVYDNYALKSSIPTVNDPKVTINQKGVKKGEFTLNQSSDITIDLTDNNTTYGLASANTGGLMSPDDKIKLDGMIIDDSGTFNWNNETNIPTKGAVSNWVYNNYVQKRGTTIFNTDTEIVNVPAAGSFTLKNITLTSSVKSGDRIKVYFRGSTSYPCYNAGIIEFELFNPSETTLAGSGTIMLTYGGVQYFMATACISALGSTSASDLTIVIHALNAFRDGAPAGAATVVLQKVERIR